MILKPQDIVIALKLVIQDQPWTYSTLSADLVMSASEINKGVKRLLCAELLRPPYPEERQPQPHRAAISEFLGHGLRYAFPQVSGGMVRGLPTSYAAPPLDEVIVASSEPVPVWPWVHGKVRGLSRQPLYRTVPEAASKDAALYEILVIAEGLRDPSVRVRNVAERLLQKRMASPTVD